MFIEPIKTFSDQTYGLLERGVSYDIAEPHARRLLRLKLVRHAHPDGSQPGAGKRPTAAVGATRASSASPAVQVSPQTTATPSGNGGKRRRRAKAAPSS